MMTKEHDAFWADPLSNVERLGAGWVAMVTVSPSYGILMTLFVAAHFRRVTGQPTQ